MMPRPGMSRWVDTIDTCPFGAVAGRHVALAQLVQPNLLQRSKTLQLYSPSERARRDNSRWTLVQGVLAPVQFLVFLISLSLVVHCVVTGRGLAIASDSVVVKTLFLYAIMITGAIWEHAVFGRYLFAPAFFWEDVFSMLVLALHTSYLLALFTAALSPHGLMLLALAAYASYVINAAQFVFKLRMARLQAPRQAV